MMSLIADVHPTAAGVAALAGCFGETSAPVAAGPLDLAARAMPHCNAWARTAVPARLHRHGLHVGHEIEQSRPVEADEVVHLSGTTGVRATRRGSLVTVSIACSVDGEPVASQTATYFFRDGDATEPSPATGPQSHAGDATHETLAVALPARLAQRYAEASGDDQALHLDDDAARDAGLPRAVVPGMLAGAVAITAICDRRGWAPAALRGFGVRFSAPIFWDDSLRVRFHDSIETNARLEFAADLERTPALTGGWMIASRATTTAHTRSTT